MNKCSNCGSEIPEKRLNTFPNTNICSADCNEEIKFKEHFMAMLKSRNFCHCRTKFALDIAQQPQKEPAQLKPQLFIAIQLAGRFFALESEGKKPFSCSKKTYYRG